jgi:hypothetical protein
MTPKTAATPPGVICSTVTVSVSNASVGAALAVACANVPDRRG